MYASLHNHTDYSNASLGFADSIIKYNQLIDTAYELGLSAVSITDHEGIISHVKALQYYNKMGLQRPFKLILGNEIYLLSEAQDNIMRNNEEGGVPYYHFLLNALNNKGHEQIRRLSDRAWKRSYTYHGIVRTPTYYSDLEEIIGSEKGNVIASSACLGSFIDKSFLQGDTQTAISAMKYFDNLFGHGNFFLEIQPCYDYNIEQKSVNEFLWKSGQELGIPVIVTTDSHYLNKDSAYAHKVLLNAKDGGDARETEEFYATTYLMGAEELRNYLHLSFTDEQIDIMFENTNSIAERVEGYKFQHPPMIPMRPLADLGEFHIAHRYKKYYDKYTEFGYYANISMENNPYKEGVDIEALVKQDQYVFYRLEKALKELVEDKGKDVEVYIDRLNKELHELRLISENFNSSMASYYTCMSKIIELIWEVNSLSMPSRGSGMGYVICYLLEITQIDPVPLGSFAPHWRHLSAERGYEIADIDNDSQNAKRGEIIDAMINYFGEDRVLNVLTVSTLSGKTAVEKAGKGLKKLGVPITDETIGYFKSLVPTERGQVWSLKDCFYGNEEKGRRPVNELVIGVEEYAGMKECMFAFEGLIINRGIHASGVLVGNNPYVEQISAMRSPTGVLCSCYDLHDAEYCGWTKVDILTIQASDKIRKTMDLLIEHGKMEWQGNLKKTYWKYLHPDVLDYETPAMWEMIKQIYSIFQFDTPVAVNALNKVNPRSVMDLSATNSLLRLMAREGRESPLDLYARYHNDINEWYKDMDKYGLTKEEQEILKEHLSGSYGLADSQEKVMLLSMDERVSGFTLKEANTLRKSIAKKRADVLEETKIKFYNGCRNQGCSDKLANYVWEEQFGMSFGYSFSQLHSYAYSVIALQELNLNYYYPRVYWNTACLTIEAKADEDSKGNIDYGKIAKAIYKMQKFGIKVVPPDINKSGIEFTPNEETNSILFGLGGISGINIDIARQIIANRPYNNFRDFYDKNCKANYENSLITKSKFIMLIKAGCFDETDDRIGAMKWLIALENPAKTSLNGQNLSSVIDVGVNLDAEKVRMYRFKKYVLSKKFFYCTDPKFKSKKHYLLEPVYALPYFEEKFMDNLKEGQDYYYTADGTVVVDKSLEKATAPYLNSLKKDLARTEIINEYNQKLWAKIYSETIGEENLNKWVFDAISFYPNGDHELKDINEEEYNIDHFVDLSVEPKFTEKSFGSRTWKEYELSRICGTVLDKKDNGHFITILTNDNEVVHVKFNKDQYAYYKQSIKCNGIIDDGYFKRGTLLLITGYRRGDDEFVAKNYKSSIYDHTCMRAVNACQDGSLELQMERLTEED